jgi:hypothetical protein
MMKRIYLLVALLAFIKVDGAKAQITPKDSLINAPMIFFSYTFQLPGGDMKDRFGPNSNIGIHFLDKTKTNWLWGVEWNFLFGRNIKENTILDGIKTDNGNVIDRNGEFAEIRLYQRGHYAGARLGRLFAYGPNKNSGFFATLGLAYLQHKIRIDEVFRRTPQLSPDYKRGYDRLTSGLCVNQSIGYIFLSNNRLTNFYAAFETYQCFGRSRRSFDFDRMERDDKQRIDLLTGFRFGIIIPLYKKLPNDYYFD